MSWLSTVVSISMAVGPPLVYADQTFSIVRKRQDIYSSCMCSVLFSVIEMQVDFPVILLANITRCFFWLGDHFEITLLIQSILMILAQVGLLYICILFRPKLVESFQRPFSFWQWPSCVQYIEFLCGFIICQAIAFLILGHSQFYVNTLGFVALGLESTLPIPQLISNFRQRSLYGFRSSTMIGWLGGDAFKTVYFFWRGAPLQFKVCAIFQLSVDVAILIQRVIYGNSPPISVIADDVDELEEALALADED